MRRPLVLLFFLAMAAPLAFAQSSFFANPGIQSQALGAFALQAESHAFLRELGRESARERDQLYQAFLAHPEISQKLPLVGTLSQPELEALLRVMFDVQVKVMNVPAPELVFDDQAPTGAAYFDFNLQAPGAGRVILNVKELMGEKNKIAPVLLLVHETRHSLQFQKAFLSLGAATPAQVGAYRSAFAAQKQLAGKLSFCDFLTLNNEFEAFQYANEIIGKFFGFKVDDPGMGTFASQFDAHGKLKIDLLDLHARSPGRVLEDFNELEKEQYRQLKGAP